MVRAGSTSGRVQAACTVALLETAQCGARAGLGLDDVSCLLAGLQSPLEVRIYCRYCLLLCLPLTTHNELKMHKYIYKNQNNNINSN